MSEQYNIRPMMISDIEQVLDVEKESFRMPWIRQAFINELVKNSFAHYLVASDQQRIIGYCGVWIAVDEAHITNIAVLSAYRNQGVGRSLLKAIIAQALNFGVKTLTLEVRESNSIAQHFYSVFGFQKTGVKKGYYTDNSEDAWIMSLTF
ncbi:ribosomal protein S18-alanine N-acetyltransferase [Natribacillus halophilus]|uniref:[Ribosomal protein bS18]-alanine N-acetyltransferase n=1 Tax=Natribacillus halophilus TaxID=549003 RepID=A0A1G8SQ87_9BACI|nr:ribosomal protein S18-alanine N-acetyltransferase [Natribacillus halophilus]SDJ31381.1 ribosomal-protein-alanine N-acetyltransferase [Natribacillus halophilus]